MHGRVFAILLTLIPAPALAAPLLMPAVPGWVLAHSQKAGGSAIAEYVPRGQTVQNFRRMITTTRIAGAGKMTPLQLITEFTKRYVAGCPGATGGAVPMGKDAGVRIDCRRHPKTGMPDTVFARAIADGPDQYLAQVTFREMVMAPDATWARNVLGAMKLGR